MRKLLVILFVVLLSSCGGGSSSLPVISMYGDSLSSGNGLEVPPAPRLSQLLGQRYEVQLRGVSGAIISQSFTSQSRSGVDWPWLAFSQQLKKDHPAIILLRWGGGDAVVNTDPEVFRSLLTRAVIEAKASGAKVYLIGIIPLPETPEFIQRSAANEIINQEVAAQQGVTFIGLRDLPFDRAVDIEPDNVHPLQAYSDRIMQRIAQIIDK